MANYQEAPAIRSWNSSAETGTGLKAVRCRKTVLEKTAAAEAVVAVAARHIPGRQSTAVPGPGRLWIAARRWTAAVAADCRWQQRQFAEREHRTSSRQGMQLTAAFALSGPGRTARCLGLAMCLELRQRRNPETIRWPVAALGKKKKGEGVIKSLLTNENKSKR